MNIETIAIQAGRNTDAQTGAVMPPIHLSTTFLRDNEGDFVLQSILLFNCWRLAMIHLGTMVISLIK